jgi:hypothetical protein
LLGEKVPVAVVVVEPDVVLEEVKLKTPPVYVGQVARRPVYPQPAKPLIVQAIGRPT